MIKKQSSGLFKAMLAMVVLPMIVLSLVVSAFGVGRFRRVIYDEVQDELRSICSMTLGSYNILYPGDFHLEGDEQKIFYKGDVPLNGDHELLNEIQRDTGAEITIFYYDTRILTTIKNEEGADIVGTGSSAIVMRDVYQNGGDGFYPGVDIKGESFYAFYMPIRNSAGQIIGMIGAAKPEATVMTTLYKSVIPLLLLIIVLAAIAGYISYRFVRKMAHHITTMQSYMEVTMSGDFTASMPYDVTARKDELGLMAKAMVRMQTSLQNLVERDALTGLFNRRFGNKCLADIVRSKEVEGIDYCVSIGDIDFFKKVNDTYGHDAGDEVLRMVSSHLKKHMRGCGYAARWGGEEFLLIYKKNKEEAKELLETLLRELRFKVLDYGEESIKVTMSFGLMEVQETDTPDSMIRMADDRLYIAKKSGRNRIIAD
ncbi:MAG: diguanylate cyclase [Lachnospiraceae bacterium]|nr:diguanylate cyclase [Lachnospiraceae bacterium]